MIDQPPSVSAAAAVRETLVPRLLLVEDDPLLARALARLLRSTGAQVSHAASGQLAAQMFKVTAFDVVMTDVNLPDIGGLEVARHAREADPAVSVILMTGSPSVTTAVRAMEVGALRYLVKPTPPDVLLAAVTEGVRLSQERRLSTGVVRIPIAAPTTDPLIGRFESALGQIWMAYQPLVSIDGAPYGYEALVRSDEPSMASPVLILDAADRLRRIHDLGRRIRRTVADTVTGSPAGPLVFVNMHPLDLLDETLYRSDDPLALHASRVVLEITERATLDELKDAEARIRALRDMGYRVAVDDLGAGYAGLTTLARLSPEVVKLDMSLIRNVDRDPVRQKLVRMVAAVSHDLGAVVVAEGIETEEERATVVDLGCDLLQGHLLGRPERLGTLRARP